jgi:hypothetical protein
MSDAVTFYKLGREVSARLDIFQKRVVEGKDVQAAKEFCSFLLWSGLLNMLEEHSRTDYESDLPIDGRLIRFKCEALQDAVNHAFTEGSKTITLELSAMEAINRKLDLLAGHMAKIVT